MMSWACIAPNHSTTPATDAGPPLPRSSRLVIRRLRAVVTSMATTLEPAYDSQRPRIGRYSVIRLLVDESSSAAGASDAVSFGASWLAITLPSSTPHWSNELISQIVPWVNAMCS